MEQGGWMNIHAVGHFCAYVRRIVEELSGDVTYWVTINEPLIYLFYGYITGAWPPNIRSLPKAILVRRNLIVSHIEAYRLIHKIYAKRSLSSPMVSIAHHMPAFVACTRRLRDRAGVWLRNKAINDDILQVLCRNKTLDYIGVNYYSRTLVHTDRWSIRELLFESCRHHDDTLAKNSMGWEIYPKGLYEILLGLRKYGLPVFILENGISTGDDGLRWEFIRAHLQAAYEAIQEGVPLIGYIYWSLIDNFEWDKGFTPRFGLIGIDYATGARTIRESARKYSKVCLTNLLE